MKRAILIRETILVVENLSPSDTFNMHKPDDYFMVKSDEKRVHAHCKLLPDVLLRCCNIVHMAHIKQVMIYTLFKK